MKWQTAFWALVPLAVGAMTQPCGCVLSLPESARFWLRCSPIVCIADSAYWVALVAADTVTAVYRTGSLSIEPLRSQLAYRFRGDDGSDWDDTLPILPQEYQHDRAGRNGPTPQAVPRPAESRTPIRLCLIALAGIPCQTIKLVAMDGIPWTKAWALMFFISIVVGETQHILARVLLRRGLVDLTNLRLRRSNSTWWPWLRSSALIPVGCHVILASYALTASLAKAISPLSVAAFIISFIFPVVVAYLTGTLRGLFAYVGDELGSLFYPQDGGEVTDLDLTSALFVHGVWIGANTAASTVLFPIKELAEDGDLRAAVLFLSSSLLLSMLAICWTLFLLEPFLLFRILAGWRARMFEFSTRFVWFYTILGTLLYYWQLFDPIGTRNPSWTGVFG